jgi:hypothetical protein
MLAIAVLCLILAGVFAPRSSVEAKAIVAPEYAIEEVSGWLFRLAAWTPTEVQLEHPSCGAATHTVGFWDYL